MKKTIWIGLSGKAGSGKTTVSDTLCKRYRFVKLSFAEELKTIAKRLQLDIFDRPKAEYRPKLQQFGMAARRIFSEDVWMNLVLQHIKLMGYQRVIIDDVRFLNEFLGLQRAGFKLVRINRSKTLREKFGYNVKDEHPSECQLDNVPHEQWDLVVYNHWDYPFGEAAEEIASNFGVKREKRRNKKTRKRT